MDYLNLVATMAEGNDLPSCFGLFIW